MMQKYDSYKDSGVQWLGEIPSHWEVIKTSRVFTKIGSGTTPESGREDYYSEDGFHFLQTGDLNDAIINDTAKKITEKALRDKNLKIYPQGSLVVAMYGATIGKLGLLDIDTTVNQACCVLAETNKMFMKFAFYVFFSAKRDLIFQCKGGGQPNISQDTIRNEKIPVPPLSEQSSIAAYLDGQTARIDTAIAQQQKMIDLLNERKQIIINRAVTKGLNPNAKMKDSGVEWIGEVPEGWEERRMRYLCKITTGDKDTINRVDDGKYPFYVRSPKVERINSYTFDGEAVLMAGDGVGAGKVFHYVNGRFGCHQRVYIFHHISKVLGKYLYYYMQTKFKYVIEQLSAKSTVDSVRLNMIQDFIVLIPPIEEQQRIVDFISAEVSKIDTAINRLNQMISLLQERKQIIINEVVTGKVKVC